MSTLYLGGEAVPLGSVFQSGGSNVYSTEEIVVGTWIDGKPIYRKVISGSHTFPVTSGNTYKDEYLNKPINDVSTMIDVHTMLYSPRNYSIPWDTPVPYNQMYNGSLWYVNSAFDYKKKDIYFRYQWPNNSATCTYIIILQYTKTTDTATVSLDEPVSPDAIPSAAVSS